MNFSRKSLFQPYNNNNNNNNIQVYEHLYITTLTNTSGFSFQNSSPNSKTKNSFNLDDQIYNLLKMAPRCFTITTNSGSYQFNIEMLKDMSPVISDILNKDPKNLKYHIDITDDVNAMAKLEKLFQGENIKFDNKEIPNIRQIIDSLKITRCPLYILNQSKDVLTDQRRNFWDFGSSVTFSTSSLLFFYQNVVQENFIISTNRQDYKCNNFGILSSNVICEMIKANQNLESYKYDFDDEYQEFQIICDLFDFKPIKITLNNMDSLKKIATDLEITCLLDKLDLYFENYENAIQTIDDEQLLIDEIDEIFEWLYDIKKITVKTVQNKILKSDWIQSTTSVQELAAIILQVINADFIYHSYLIELIVLLNNESNEDNCINILVPFLSEKLLNSIGESKLNCSFIYLLIKNGFLSIEKVIDKIMMVDHFINKKEMTESEKSSFTMNEHNNVVLWFFPELLTKVDDKKLFIGLYENYSNYIHKYYPSNIEGFKKIREKGEPSDEITNSLRNDNVDQFQSIISMNGIDIKSGYIPFDIFFHLIKLKEMSYINYAAFCGSINCFKFLFLNHAKLDNYTYRCAVFGGNLEIVRIVSQDKDNATNGKNINFDVFILDGNSTTVKYNLPNDSALRESIHLFSQFRSFVLQRNPLFFTIIKHQDELFDWILQTSVLNKGKTGNELIDLIILSIQNGNAHSLVECINQGFDITLLPIQQVYNLISFSASLGYYKLTQLLFKISNELIEKEIKKEEEAKNNSTFKLSAGKSFDYYLSWVKFGNLSIFKLIIDKLKPPDESQLTDCFYLAVEKNYFSIISYIFDEFNFEPTTPVMNKSLKIAIDNKMDAIFEYLLDRYKIIPSIDVLLSACKSGNAKISKKLIDLIYEENPSIDFSDTLIQSGLNGLLEAFQYLVDKKVCFKISKLKSIASKFIQSNEKTFIILMGIADPESKEVMIKGALTEAIQNHKKETVKFLLNENVDLNNSLFEAIESDDLEIFDMILEHNKKPFFVNQIDEEKGTPLHFAVINNKLDFVKRLLAVPGINPNLYSFGYETPLCAAVTNIYVDIVDAILDFYGDDIQSQIWQVNESLKCLVPCSLNKNGIAILNRLVRIENVDLNIYTENVDLLIRAIELNEIELVKYLLSKEEVDVNSFSGRNFITPLEYAIKSRNDEVAKLLIETPRCNINLNDSNLYSPLNYAVNMNNSKIVKLLVNNEKFDPIESNINTAFIYTNNYEILLDLSKFKELDVNDSIFNSTLMNAISQNDIKKIELIISHPSFNKVKSNLFECLCVSISTENVEVFKKLFKLYDNQLCFINENTGDDFNVLIYSIDHQGLIIFNEIMTNIEKYNFEKVSIREVFNELITSSSLNYFVDQYNITDILNKIIQYDESHHHEINFNEMLPNGCSYLTSLHYMNFYEPIVNFFLDHGCDPNLPDSNGVYPLEHSILNGLYGLPEILIKTWKIDLSVKVGEKKQSYLQLAVKKDVHEAFHLIVEFDHRQVNLEDIDGDTPLIMAVRNKRISLAACLLDLSDIDYLHENLKGESAASICFDSINEKKSSVGKNQSKNTRFFENANAEKNDFDSIQIDNVDPKSISKDDFKAILMKWYMASI